MFAGPEDVEVFCCRLSSHGQENGCSSAHRRQVSQKPDVKHASKIDVVKEAWSAECVVLARHPPAHVGHGGMNLRSFSMCSL